MLAGAPGGPLHGVPVVIKDEWPLPWRAQRFGAAEMLAPTAPGESGPYRALRDAGAVIVGVANMHELGASSTGNVSVYGAARNPWDTERCPGGSSSGPAASVAARLVAGSVGADGIGSIRFPAAYCGLTGLKPTFARSAMAGHHMDGVSTHDRLRAALRRRRRLPPARLDALRRAARRRRCGRACGSASSATPSPRTSTPEVREACEAAIEALRARDRRRDPRGRAGRSRRGLAGDRPDRQRREPRRGHARAAQRPRPRDQPDQPRLPQVPDAAAGCRERARRTGSAP